MHPARTRNATTPINYFIVAIEFNMSDITEMIQYETNMLTNYHDKLGSSNTKYMVNVHRNSDTYKSNKMTRNRTETV